jgi:hypothetical protein
MSRLVKLAVRHSREDRRQLLAEGHGLIELIAVDNAAATARIQIGGANQRLYGPQHIGNVAFATVPLARLSVPPLPRTTGIDWSTASYVQPSAGGSLAPTVQLCVKPFRLGLPFF